MHELSVAQSICDSVLARVGSGRVEELHVDVGALSGVNAESLEFIMPDAAQITGLTLDRFEIRTVPARRRCGCGHEYEAQDLIEPCPQCGGFERTIIDGEDVVVTRLVVVEEDERAA